MADLSIQILSDLHLEAPSAYDVFSITPKAPYLALLGDIGNSRDDGLFQFLKNQLEKFKVVFLVLGNHEPYHSDWAETRKKFRSFDEKIRQRRMQGEAVGKFVLLDRTRYDISPDVTILGCTLYSKISDEQREHVSFGLNDFYHIKDWNVELHNAAHSVDVKWLNEQVELISQTEPHRRVTILTHHNPCVLKQSVDPRHAKSTLASGFSTDLSNEACWAHSIVRTWVFGHTHFNCDFKDPKTGKRVVTSQRGYYFAQAAAFDAEKTISL
jgi:Calcineurin-like phosphoesterase